MIYTCVSRETSRSLSANTGMVYYAIIYIVISYGYKYRQSRYSGLVQLTTGHPDGAANLSDNIFRQGGLLYEITFDRASILVM